MFRSPRSDLGDWGKQYGLLALAYQRNGDEEALKTNPIDHLFKLYVQINAEMSAEKEMIEAQKKEGKDVSDLEAKSLDEQARQYFRRMVRQDRLLRCIFPLSMHRADSCMDRPTGMRQFSPNGSVSGISVSPSTRVRQLRNVQ